MKKRFLCLLLSAVMALALMAGCAGFGSVSTNESPNAASTSGAVDTTPASAKKALTDYTDVMKITVYYAGGAAAPGSSDNEYAKYVMDNFKIDLSECTWPTGEDAMEKLSVYLLSKEMPDVIQYGVTSDGIRVFNEYVKAGMLLNVEDYFDVMPDLTSYYTDDILKPYRSTDGKLYILPSFTVPEQMKDQLSVEANLVFAINNELLSAAGGKVPATTDELYEYLKACKAQADINGKKVIPFLSITDLGNDFMSTASSGGNGPLPGMFGVYRNRLQTDDANQKMVIPEEKPEYLEYLKFAAKLFREGLVDSDVFNSTWQQNYEKFKEGRVGMILMWPNDLLGLNNYIKQQRGESAGYEPVKFIKAPEVTDSSKYWLVSTLGWSCSVFSNKVSDPERLLKFVNWQVSKEGWLMSVYGPPSDDSYVYIKDGKSVYDQQKLEKKNSEDPQWTSKLGGWAYFINGILKYYPSQICDDAPGPHIYRAKAKELNASELDFNSKFERYSLMTPGPVRVEKWPAVLSVFTQNESRIMLQAKDDAEVERMYSAMMEEANAAGLQEILKEDYLRYQTMK